MDIESTNKSAAPSTRWYLGDKDTKFSERRFCGGRLSSVPFVLLHIFFLILIIFIIMFPILYYIVIPHTIENFLSEASNQFAMTSAKVEVVLLSTITMSYQFSKTTNYGFLFSGQVVAPFTIVVANVKSTGNKLANISFKSPIYYNFNGQSTYNGSVVIDVLDTAGFLNLMLCGDCAPNTTGKAEMEASMTATLWGSTFYNSFPLQWNSQVSNTSSLINAVNSITSAIPTTLPSVTSAIPTTLPSVISAIPTTLPSI